MKKEKKQIVLNGSLLRPLSVGPRHSDRSSRLATRLTQESASSASDSLFLTSL